MQTTVNDAISLVQAWRERNAAAAAAAVHQAAKPQAPAPRAKTPDEAREALLGFVRGMTAHYAGRADSLTPQQMCDGVAHSVLAAIDGMVAGLPPMDLTVAPEPQARMRALELGLDWYPPGMLINQVPLAGRYFEKVPDAEE